MGSPLSKNLKMLITGGTGFVGRHLQEACSQEGIAYFAFSKKQYDLTLKEQADAVFSAHRDAEAIVHLACYQAAAEFPAQHPCDQFAINNLIHMNVLEAWRRFLPRANLFAIGSSCAYPSRASVLSEDKFLDGEIHGSVYSYAFTKRLLYTGILAYNDQYHLNGSYLIPPTMFGEYDDFRIETAHVTGALIGKMVRAVQERGRSVEIWGDGTQKREFLYVKDFIRALLYLLPRCKRDIVNVGPGCGISIRDLAMMIQQSAGFGGELVFKPDAYTGVREKWMDARKLETKYQWKIDPDIRTGLKRAVDWYAQEGYKIQQTPKFTNASPGA